MRSDKVLLAWRRIEVEIKTQREEDDLSQDKKRDGLSTSKKEGPQDASEEKQLDKWKTVVVEENEEVISVF